MVGVIVVVSSFSIKQQDFFNTSAKCAKIFKDKEESSHSARSAKETVIDYKLNNVSHFSCESSLNSHGSVRFQYEVSGVDIQGNTFYIHDHTAPSESSSGAGGVSDYCYKRNGILVESDQDISRATTGPLRIPGSCQFSGEADYTYNK